MRNGCNDNTIISIKYLRPFYKFCPKEYFFSLPSKVSMRDNLRFTPRDPARQQGHHSINLRFTNKEEMKIENKGILTRRSHF